MDDEEVDGSGNQQDGDADSKVDDGESEAAAEPDGLGNEPEDLCLPRLFMGSRMYLGGAEVLETDHRQAEEVESFCPKVTLNDMRTGAPRKHGRD